MITLIIHVLKLSQRTKFCLYFVLTVYKIQRFQNVFLDQFQENTQKKMILIKN